MLCALLYDASSSNKGPIYFRDTISSDYITRHTDMNNSNVESIEKRESRFVKCLKYYVYNRVKFDFQN